MQATGRLVLALLALLLAPAPLPAAGRSLSFDERVAARRAIERVRYAHQLGAARPFREAVPESVLRAKVHTALRQSAALEILWGRPITREMLEAELARIARATRFPHRLREIYAALGHDPVLVLETFVRPLLAERLLRTYCRSDGACASGMDGGRAGGPRAPEASRPAAEPSPSRRFDAWWRAVGPWLGAAEVETVAEPVPLPEPETSQASCLPDGTWTPYITDVPEVSFEGAWTGSRMLIFGRGEGAQYDPAAGTWTPMSLAGAPATLQPAAVWTGTEMIVWGGVDPNGVTVDTGARYDPLTDTWTPMSTFKAPQARLYHSGVWTGSEMIVWGGRSTSFPTDTQLDTGGRYDPAQDRWTRLQRTGAPSPRDNHRALWTGTEMIVWGGLDAAGELGTGARYSPATNSWTPVTTVNAPEARVYHATVWSGAHMIVWGGQGAGSDLASGGRYDPAADSWTPVSTANAPEARKRAGAVWDGTGMIIWAGDQATLDLRNGGRYDPATDTWTALSTTNAPLHSDDPVALWTGSEMLIWGGGKLNQYQGGRYDPATDAWTPIESTPVPDGRALHTTVWTGNEMIVWGGSDFPFRQFGNKGDGGIYDPLTSSWRPMSTLGAPSPRTEHTAVWTGHTMIIWGGLELPYDSTTAFNDGARYDPISDTWTPVSLAGAPVPRHLHTAVWTGEEMIVWGGAVGPFSEGTATGGRYRPGPDTWAPTAFGPPPRVSHTAVWTGEEVIVWGGARDYWGNGLSNQGYRYDPAADTWSAMSTSGAPSARDAHTGVWAGDRLVVWGGWDGFSQEYGDGDVYDPISDAWAPAASAGAPSGRYSHSAVVAGNRVIIWGGIGPFPGPGSGGIYDVDADSWTSTAGPFEEEPRYYHGAVWTGSEMIIWGGYLNLDTGARYALGHSSDDDGDGLDECAGDCNDAIPSVYPGAAEICDGLDSDCDGAVPADEADADGDGSRPCAGDCADDDPTVLGIAPPVELTEATDLTVSGNLRLEWIDTATTGSAIVYDVYSGLISGVAPGGDLSGGACRAEDLTTRSYEDAGPDPPPGDAMYFIVRGQTLCGDGTYGDANRDTTAAAGASPCL